MNSVVIYTDGSCNNHDHSRGGYGLVVIRGDEIRQYCGGSYFNTTSARMELTGVVRGLEKVKEGEFVKVYCDNQYVVHSLEKGWIFKWQMQNFRARKNCDLLKLLLKQYTRLKGQVVFEWVRGHNGDEYNEIADQLAAMGAQKDKKIKDIRYN